MTMAQDTGQTEQPTTEKGTAFPQHLLLGKTLMWLGFQSNMKDISPKLIQLIVDELELRTEAVKDFLLIALENAELFDKKHLDYGPRNMSAFGVLTPIIRANEKFERLKNIYKNRRGVAVNEAIIDSFIDISNLCIIALMMESGKWPDYTPAQPAPKRVRKKPTSPTGLGVGATTPPSSIKQLSQPF